MAPVQRAVIFDFGGVLMKTVDYTPRHRWDERLGLPHGSVERVVHNSGSWVLAQTGAISLETYWADVARQLGLTPQEVQQVARDFYSGDQLDDALIQYIRQLRQSGHTVALLSNDSLELLDKLKYLNIAALFDPLVVSARTGILKPASESYHTILDLMGRPANEAIFIDDRLDNITGAQAVGIHTVHYTAEMNLPAAMNGLLTVSS